MAIVIDNENHPRGAWASSRKLAIRLGQHLINDERMPLQLRQYLLDNRTVALDVLEDAVKDFDLHFEFKILRLTEQLKDAARAGAFGPLWIPNTLDGNGAKIPTPVGEIVLLFNDIYSQEFLDQFDEEGVPLPQDPEGG